MELNHYISHWKKAFLQPNNSDVLVNLVPHKNALWLDGQKWNPSSFLSLPFSPFTKKIFTAYQKNRKESGVHTAGLANGLIRFDFEGKNYSCPLLIVNCSVKKNRIKEQYEFNPIDEPYFNPFIEKLLEFSFQTDNVEEALHILSEKGLVYTFDEGVHVANFNPQRFVLLKELEVISEQNCSNRLLDNLLLGEQESLFKLNLHEGKLFSLDPDQFHAIESIKDKNLVIQGPPGTGKSHVIATLLGKVLGANGNALVLAEKNVALSVIFEQFKKHELHHLCLFYPNQVNTKVVVDSLKGTWQFLEELTSDHQSFYPTSDLILNQLNLILARLNEPKLIGGFTFAKYQENCPDFSQEEYTYTGVLPDLPQWEEDKKQLSYVSDEALQGLVRVGFNLRLLNRSDALTVFLADFERIKKYVELDGMQGWTFNDLRLQMQKSALTAHFFHEGVLLPKQLLNPAGKTFKLFFKLYKELVEKTEELALLEEEKENWSKSFNLTELLDYMKALSSTNRFNLRERWKRKELKKYANLDMEVAKKGLERLVASKNLEREIVDLKKQIRKLDLPTEYSSLHQVEYLLKRLKQADQNLLQELKNLPQDELIRLNNQAKNLQIVYSFFTSNFYDMEEKKASLGEICTEIAHDLPLITQHVKLIQTVSYASKQVFKNCETVTFANELIYQQHWQRFVGRYPELAHYSADNFTQKMATYIKQEAIETELFAKYILGIQKQKFDAYHTLLSTPAQKLDTAQKVLKQTLRKGKSILVKNFGKSRNHASFRELMESEAAIWIKLLHPIFLMTPFSLAKHVPVEKDSFDLLVIDEASQMPLSHSTGGMFRCKRGVVVGDEQQMSPASYFKSQETASETVLNQASFYWKQVILSYHYRSEHPALMQFSNQHFYENRLHVFPTPKVGHPIKLIDVADGIYEDRVNRAEAKCAAEEIVRLMEQKEQIGIVAFSQAQLKEILNYIPPDKLAVLEDDEQHDYLLQSLENVQGDQCDHLIVSLGYGYNAAGKFHMRFGPLSTTYGSKRLNVLMSRARKKITFIRSVKSEDFPISDKEGVESLRKLMRYLENTSTYHQSMDFSAIFKHVEVKADVINVQRFYQDEQDALTLILKYKILTNKGWKVCLMMN